MNIIAICNTYYQLITLLQLQNTVFINDNIYCYISDHSKNYKKICDNLSSSSSFYKNFYIDTKDYLYSNKSKIDNIIETKDLIWGNDSFFRELDNIKIDKILFYNFSYFVRILYLRALDKNKNVKVYRFEEGMLSNRLVYISNEKTVHISNMIRRFFHKKVLEDNIEGFYSFSPLFSLHNNNLQIPSIKTTDQ